MPIYNNEAFGRGVDNLLKLFQPPSGQEAAGWAAANERNAKAKRDQEAYERMTEPGATPTIVDQFGIASGAYTPTQSYHAVDVASGDRRYDTDVTARTSLATNAADNARAIREREIQEASALQRQFAEPIKLNQGETAILPRQTVEATGLDPRLAGAPKPQSETEWKAGQGERLRQTGQLTDQDLRDIIVGDKAPVEALDAAGRPTFMSPGAAVRSGAQPAPRSPSTVINNGSESGDFYKEADKARGKSFNDVADAGATAQRTMIQIDELDRTLANVGTGGLAAMKQFAGSYGLPVGDLSDSQAATALINQLVPAQRPPGSGSMSDGDVALFKQSLPRIVNQPGGNALIVRTMRGIAKYDVQRGDIANRVLNREITPAEGNRLMAALPNPLAEFRQSDGRESTGGTARPGAAAPPSTGSGFRQGQPSGGQVARPTSDAEFNALPAGSLYIDPDDGQTYRK